METGRKNNGIIIKGASNWQPVLLNIMDKAGIQADVMEHFTRRGQSTVWLFSKKSRPYRVIYHLGGCSAIFCVLARLMGKQMVSHWIGTDAMRYQGKMNPIKYLGVWVQRHLVALHLSDSEITPKSSAMIFLIFFRNTNTAPPKTNKPAPTPMNILVF